MRVPRESVVPAVHSSGFRAELHGVHRLHGEQRGSAEPVLAALREPVELHARTLQSVRESSGNQRRRYEKAICMIGNVIEFYDFDKFFPVYGFGACRMGSTTTEHCFALNGNEANPEVHGVQGIMDLYHQQLVQLRFSGPTLFAPCLAKAATLLFV